MLYSLCLHKNNRHNIIKAGEYEKKIYIQVILNRCNTLYMSFEMFKKIIMVEQLL